MRYELFHDVLAEPILDWRRGYEQRRARRRWAAIGAVLLALVAVFAGLGIWALIEQGHAQSRANDLYRVNTHLKTTNSHLEKKKQTLQKQVKAKNSKTSATLKALTATNQSLRHSATGLEEQRNVFASGIRSLKAQNRRLVTRIHRLNRDDKSLAATIYRLRRGFNRMDVRLSLLRSMDNNLTADVGILKIERASLTRQLRQDNRELARLTPIAVALGYAVNLVSPTHGGGFRSPPPAKRAAAHQFPTPAELGTYDTLRKKVAELQRKLANLESRQARIGLLRRENRLLRKQLVALRTEDAKLAATRARLRTREHGLAVTLVAARREHARLGAQARVARGAFRTEARKLARRTKKHSELQSKDNGRVQHLGSLQERIAEVRPVDTKLVTFLSAVTKQLVQAAKSSSITADAAALFAVEAFHVTPYNVDATAHPGPYNALWLALDRLDPSAASALVTPKAGSGGKIGTTRSKLLKQKICSLVSVSAKITKTTWENYVHVPQAQYPLPPLEAPCGT